MGSHGERGPRGVGAHKYWNRHRNPAREENDANTKAGPSTAQITSAANCNRIIKSPTDRQHKDWPQQSHPLLCVH